jgi:hypothetical protein
MFYRVQFDDGVADVVGVKSLAPVTDVSSKKRTVPFTKDSEVALNQRVLACWSANKKWYHATVKEISAKRPVLTAADATPSTATEKAKQQKVAGRPLLFLFGLHHDALVPFAPRRR